MSGLADVAEALTPWFGERLGVAGVELVDLRRHAEGWSWQTYTMDADWLVPGTGEPMRRGYAVRVEPHDGLLAPYDIDGQYRLHRAVLDHADVPMADLYWLEHDTSVLGMPFYVMERLHGIVPVQWRGDDPLAVSRPTRRADDRSACSSSTSQAPHPRPRLEGRPGSTCRAADVRLIPAASAHH